MVMMEELLKFLIDFKPSKISTLQLADQCPQLQYDEFASIIFQLNQRNILQPIKASGVNGKSPLLANTYKINKSLLQQDVREKVKQLKKVFHKDIWIEYYLTKSMDELQQDLPALILLNNYLQENNFPCNKALAQERSFEIFHNEKYITQEGGKHLLEKVKVWNQLEIWPIADPISFAIHPELLSRDKHNLLIVENKATFYSLLPILKESIFTALIYGQGNAINGTITVLKDQLPIDYSKVSYYYFGDLDAQGITIWYFLNQKIDAKPAIPFYKACLNRSAAVGKEYQRINKTALDAFLNYFNEYDQLKILETIQEGLYYPQEILKTNELQEIWRNSDWT